MELVLPDVSMHAMVLIAAGFVLATSGAPRTGDSSTGSGNLPPCPSSPNCVSSQAKDPAQQVDPIPYRVSQAEALSVLINTIQHQPRTHIVTKTHNYLHAEFTSLIFRFVDDVECVIDESTKAIQIRSASRVGYWDFGVNRRRVENLRRELIPRLRESSTHTDGDGGTTTPR